MLLNLENVNNEDLENKILVLNLNDGHDVHFFPKNMVEEMFFEFLYKLKSENKIVINDIEIEKTITEKYGNSNT